jgi:hypothetical protein
MNSLINISIGRSFSDYAVLKISNLNNCQIFWYSMRSYLKKLMVSFLEILTKLLLISKVKDKGKHHQKMLREEKELQRNN